MSDEAPVPINEAPNLLIPWPTVRPLGISVTVDGVKEAWDVIVKPLANGPQSIEVRVLMGIVRAVYDGMYGLTRGDES